MSHPGAVRVLCLVSRDGAAPSRAPDPQGLGLPPNLEGEREKGVW